MCPSGTSLRREMAPNSQFRQAFDVLDTDRDGKISREDLRRFYGDGVDEDVIGTMISVADQNKNGYVEYDEFERVLDCNMKKKKNSGKIGVLEDAFRVMDRDGDGKVSVEDLKFYMKWAGFSASDEDIRAMIRLGGGDLNDGVSFDSFLKILAIDREE
ncbi:EF-hand domain [Dillenia turbinata]|uniref:EF-hand domain n=1 Tax=Dillenia turbinata TaxID=194707 RepID=A0AAN8UB26_9MAGN